MTTDQEMVAGPLFELVWTTLVDVLGTATTASLFRKAAKDARALRPDRKDLQHFEIVRDGLEFRYILPPSWQQEGRGNMDSLRFLVQAALCPLLIEWTGTVVVDLLDGVPELREHGIISKTGSPS